MVSLWSLSNGYIRFWLAFNCSCTIIKKTSPDLAREISLSRARNGLKKKHEKLTKNKQEGTTEIKEVVGINNKKLKTCEKPKQHKQCKDINNTKIINDDKISVENNNKIKKTSKRIKTRSKTIKTTSKNQKKKKPLKKIQER